jgi:hypothetical protein
VAKLETVRTALAATLLALVMAPAAAAAAPLVPVQQQVQMKTILSGFGYVALAYVPAKAPPHYTYQANVVNASQNLITLGDGPALAYFTVKFLNAKLSTCSAGSQISLTIAGIKVYSKGADVWRCLAAPGGQAVKVNATGAGLSRQALGTVIASATRAASK